eukprot:6473238-Amphidinium_carterae.1
MTRPRERALENSWAIGGMRCPAESNRRLNRKHRVIGAQILAMLSRRLMQDQKLRCACLHSVGTIGATGPTEEQLDQVRMELTQLLKPSPPADGALTELRVELISAWAHWAEDLDHSVIEWMRTGAPLGIERHLDMNGVFPPVDAHQVDGLDADAQLASEWTNYAGVDYNQLAHDELQAL